MTYTVVRKEMLAIIRDGRLIVLAIALLATLAGAFWSALNDYRQQEQEKSRIAQIVRDQWDHQGDKNPHRGAHYGLYVFRHSSPLTVIEPGITRDTGQSIYLEPHRRNLTRNAVSADENIATRLGRLSPSFVLHTLLPLLVIVFAFNAVTQEREQGTLRMLYSLGISGSRLLWGKLLALLLTFAAILIPGMLLGSRILDQVASPSTELFSRGLLLALAYLLYYVIFACIAIALSARSHTSRGALFILIGLWLAFALVLPRIGAATASTMLPPPSTSTFWSAIQHDYEYGLPGDGDLASRMKAYDAQLLREHGVTQLKDLPIGANAARRLVRDGYADHVHDIHFTALWNRFEAQEAIVLFASGLSPVVAMQAISRAIAGTDLAHQRDFEAQAEKYRRHVNTSIDHWDFASTKGVTSFEDKYAGNTLWQSIEAFSYTPPTLGFALGESWPSLATLAGWLMFACFLLRHSARRLVP